MNSLVGYGVSSDSDSDGDAGALNSVKEVVDADPPATKTRNFLLESGSASSDSGSEEEDRRRPSSPSPRRRAAPATGPAAWSAPFPAAGSLASSKLPPPPLNATSASSVFANPFKAQAERKLSALQKHVPLTLEAKPSQIGGKRMCVSYRKDGRCRFGIKCKFAHDSDLQTPAVPTHPPPAGDEFTAEPGGSSSGGARSQKHPEEEECGGPQVKKRRVGLSNTLIPPKKAMKQFAMFRDRERLNMS